MLSFAKFYDKINTSLVFLILNFFIFVRKYVLVYIIFWFGNMLDESPPKVWALKDILGKGFQVLNYVTNCIA